MAVHKLTPDEVNTVAVVLRSVSGLSISSSAIVLVSIALYPALRHFPTPLVAVLAVLDIITMTGYLMSPSPSEMDAMNQPGAEFSSLCLAQAALITWAAVSSALWASGISVVLYMCVVKGYKLDEHPYLTMSTMVLVCLGIATANTAIIGLFGVFGPAGAWCWIPASEVVWRWTAVYLFGWIACAVSIVNAFLMRKHLWKLIDAAQNTHTSDSLVDALQVRVRRSQLYPIMLLVIWFWPTVNRLYEALSGGDQILALFVLHRGFQGLQGFLNALAFGFAIRTQLQTSFRAYCSALCPRWVDAAVSPEGTLVAKANTNPLQRRGRSHPSDHFDKPRRSHSGNIGIQLSDMKHRSPKLAPQDGNNLQREDSEFGIDFDPVFSPLRRGTGILSEPSQAATILHATESGVTLAAMDPRSRLSVILTPAALADAQPHAHVQDWMR